MSFDVPVLDIVDQLRSNTSGRMGRIKDHTQFVLPGFSCLSALFISSQYIAVALVLLNG